MLTFLHAADLHLDSPFRSLSPDQAAERRQEQRQLLTRLADTVRESRADLLFLSGDLFDGHSIHQRLSLDSGLFSIHRGTLLSLVLNTI